MKNKNTIVIVFFLSLCSISVYHIIWGKRGIKSYTMLANQITQDKQRVHNLEKDIASLKLAIREWQNDEFSLEQCARMDLQMGSTNELVYLLQKDQ